MRGGDKPVEVAPEPKRPPRELKPEPDRIGISGSVPFVRLPNPETLFADRARRLDSLAPEHPLGAYLAFLARVATAQAVVQTAQAGTPPLTPSDTALRVEHGMPPLSSSLLRDDPSFLDGFDRLLAVVDLAAAPDSTRSARDTLCAATPDDRLDLAVQVFEGAFPMERLGECVFASAAVQVYLARQSARLDGKALKPVADGICPACGGAPVASLVVAWTAADKARYCACSLCGTLWNQVRIRCTACGSSEGVSYYGLDEVSKDVQVETCTTCHSYIKHLHQHRNPALDPVADDIASYGLDLKIAEDGFGRAGLNPLFLT
ncbi:formate dehydrogenase accessory protein FdhE [Methylobacterium sp. BTF04]|uniref:formate dehydrogenase accessory protein FdhE n=1 Tax=Methylobacterium sp. BTF04 TaxID=2708300 RepID=UPI0013D0DF87|nr:formate dehydrogenase accessory protein FdhE [Methylobacterium sp. BTF04]NEU13279.1 formate dehydrogenase accessory protein FdhE [Methylobacterium sp. BTF04]